MSNLQDKLVPEDSVDFRSDPNRSWLDRTFGTMKEGSIRGNMFLLIVTTIGSAFFILPQCARNIGLLFMCLLVLLAALLSYSCSRVLYYGFRETKANTYNECMEGLLGKKIGLASTVVIMMHTFGTSVSTWIFSWKYLRSGMMQVFGLDPENDVISIGYQHAFFYCGFLIIFTVTLFRSIEKLKVVSIVGFFMILCLVGVFISQTPRYFEHYNDMGAIQFIGFKWELYGLKAWGIIVYMFLNQYATLPIYKTTKNVNFRRITKIVGRTIFVVTLVYLTILFCGYFSLPTNAEQEIFLLRPPILGESDYIIKIGKVGFGCALFVGVMVRSHFVLIYFDQLLNKVGQALSDGSAASHTIANVNYQEGETDSMYPNTSNIVWKPRASIRNLFFLLTIATAATLGVEHLSKILGFLGSFVGVFELIIIPASMFLVIDRRRNLMSQPTRIAFVFFATFLTIVCLCAVGINFVI